jgi:polyhydroxyalkanoate synthase
MLASALAVLAARGEEPVNSATFLTTLVDFTDTGVLDVFIDESFVKMREMQFEQVPLWFLQVMKVNVHLHLHIA